MSDDHSHHEHEHAPAPPEPLLPEDSGSQALAEALRSSFAIVKVVMVLLVVLFLCSGFFTVGPQERAMILRLGKPVGEGSKALLGPGWHWSYPAPIDSVEKIPYSEIQKVRSTVGWFYTTPERELSNLDDLEEARPSLNPAQDGYTITADGNIIHTRATLYYRIEDPVRYRFGFVNASNAVQNALDNALLYASARFTVDDILRQQVAKFRETVQARVTELLQKDKYDLGIVLERCEVDSRPPRYLKKYFEAVLLALENRSKTYNEALTFENQVLAATAAEAASRTNFAQTERVTLVESVRAEADSFKNLLPRYNENPELFTSILRSQALSRVLANVQDKFYLPARADGKPRELRLQLSREPLSSPDKQKSQNPNLP